MLFSPVLLSTSINYSIMKNKIKIHNVNKKYYNYSHKLLRPISSIRVDDLRKLISNVGFECVWFVYFRLPL